MLWDSPIFNGYNMHGVSRTPLLSGLSRSYLEGVIPGVVEVDSDPWSLRPVNARQVLLEPDVLLAAHCVVDVVAQEDVVGGPDVHRVEKVRRRRARPVRRLHQQDTLLKFA